jgi:hypothetical protein
MVTTKDDINRALDYARSTGLLKGIVIIKDDSMGVWGEIQLCELSQTKQIPGG